jgi:hypothetical protein
MRRRRDAVVRAAAANPRATKALVSLAAPRQCPVSSAPSVLKAVLIESAPQTRLRREERGAVAPFRPSVMMSVHIHE